jgi:hypothetical protein
LVVVRAQLHLLGLARGDPWRDVLFAIGYRRLLLDTPHVSAASCCGEAPAFGAGGRRRLDCAAAALGKDCNVLRILDLSPPISPLCSQ